MMSGNYLPKTFWAAVTVGLGLALLPPFKPYRISLSLLGAVWLAYLLWALLSLIWAIQPRVSLERWLALLIPTLAYLLARRTGFWESDRFWTGLSIITIAFAAIGILQYFFPSFPVIHGLPGTAVPRTTMGQRNYASMYLMLTLPFLARHYFRSSGRRAVYAFGAVVLSVAFVLLAKTRGAWIGLAAGFFYFVFSGGVRRLLNRKRKLIYLLFPSLAALVLAAAVGLPAGAERSFESKTTFSDAVRTVLNPRQRLSFWRPCLGVTNPMLGAGFGNFPIAATPYLRKAEAKALNWEVHNDYLQAYVDLGVPGVLLFVMTWALLIRMAWKRRKKGMLLAAGASVTALIVMQFTTFTAEKVSTQLWMAGVAAIINSPPGRRLLFEKRLPSVIAPACNYLTVLLLFAYAVGVAYTIRGDLAFRRIRPRVMEVLTYRKVLENPGNYSPREVEYVREKEPYARLQLRVRMMELARKVLPTMPLDINMRHISSHQLAGLALSLKEYEAADIFAARALEMHPNDRNSLMILIQVALNRGDLEAALKYLERGVETFGYNPHSPFFCRTLIDIYRYYGRDAEAGVIEEKMNQNRVPDPYGPAPENRAAGIPFEAPVFEWENAPSADFHDFYLWRAGEEKPEYPTLSGLEETMVSLDERLKPDTVYLWRVISFGRYGEVEGEIWFFRTAPPENY